jgi:hypothetical protein
MKNVITLTLVFALWLVFALGCSSTGTKTNPNKSSMVTGPCKLIEVFIPTPDGGALVSGVSVTRDGSGNIATKWKTTLPSGTESMIDLGLWRPDKKKDIPFGPLMDGAGIEKTSSDGSVIENKELFTNEGKAYNQGQYYLTLTVIDNEIWHQPAATKAALAAAKGKVKAVEPGSLGGKPFGVTLDLTARFELPACADLATTAAPTPRAPMTKGQTEAMARKLYANMLETRMAKMGHPVTVTVSGEDNTTITIEDSNFTRETVMIQTTNDEYVAPFRKWHFKRLEFTDGASTWGINLE